MFLIYIFLISFFYLIPKKLIFIILRIYKHIGELDVVEGIFQDKIKNLSCDTLKEAIKAEQSDDWRIAQTKFKLVLECNEPNIFLENYKDFLFEEYYKVLK